MSTNTEPTTVRITPAVAAEFETRNVFPGLHDPGTYTVDADTAASLMADADYYSTSDGPGGDLTVGQRRAYAALASQLDAAGVARPGPVTIPDRPSAKPAPPPVPFPIGEARPGDWVTVVADGRQVQVDRDQSDAPTGRVWITVPGGGMLAPNALGADVMVTR